MHYFMSPVLSRTAFTGINLSVGLPGSHTLMDMVSTCCKINVTIKATMAQVTYLISRVGRCGYQAFYNKNREIR